MGREGQVVIKCSGKTFLKKILSTDLKEVRLGIMSGGHANVDGLASAKALKQRLCLRVVFLLYQ